jgi:hypothetical protein
MGQKMPDAFGQSYGFLMQHGIPCEGPAVARYVQAAGDAFEVEAGFYAGRSFTGDSGIECIEIAECDALTTTHIGPYDALPEAYSAIQSGGRRSSGLSRSKRRRKGAFYPPSPGRRTGRDVSTRNGTCTSVAPERAISWKLPVCSSVPSGCFSRRNLAVKEPSADARVVA